MQTCLLFYAPFLIFQNFNFFFVFQFLKKLFRIIWEFTPRSTFPIIISRSSAQRRALFLFFIFLSTTQTYTQRKSILSPPTSPVHNNGPYRARETCSKPRAFESQSPLFALPPPPHLARVYVQQLSGP